MLKKSHAALAVAWACACMSSWSIAASGRESAQPLADIRQEIQALKDQYERRIAALEARLAEAERVAGNARQQLAHHEGAVANAVTAVTRTASPEGGVAPAMSGKGFNPEVSLILQGQWLGAKDLAGRSLAGFMPAPGADGTLKRGFSAGESELVFAANVDPYWRARGIFSLQNDETVSVEEAAISSLGLPDGWGVQFGRFRSGIGYLNDQHPHTWDFADAPLAYRALFGAGANLTQEGVQAKWLAPLDEVAMTIGVEGGRGVTFPATPRNQNDMDTLAAFVKVGGDVGVAHAWQAGVSYLKANAQHREATLQDDLGADALTRFTGRSSVWLADFVWKWAPNGNPTQRNFKLQGEWFQRSEAGDLACDTPSGGAAPSCNGQVGGYDSRQSGGYLQAVYQWAPRWRAGYRWDWLDSGNVWADTPHLGGQSVALQGYKPRRDSVMLDYTLSEFSRFRLQFAQDQSMLDATDQQVILQYIMSLGAHGAHKF